MVETRPPPQGVVVVVRNQVLYRWQRILSYVLCMLQSFSLHASQTRVTREEWWQWTGWWVQRDSQGSHVPKQLLMIPEKPSFTLQVLKLWVVHHWVHPSWKHRCPRGFFPQVKHEAINMKGKANLNNSVLLEEVSRFYTQGPESSVTWAFLPLMSSELCPPASAWSQGPGVRPERHRRHLTICWPRAGCALHKVWLRRHSGQRHRNQG